MDTLLEEAAFSNMMLNGGGGGTDAILDSPNEMLLDAVSPSMIGLPPGLNRTAVEVEVRKLLSNENIQRKLYRTTTPAYPECAENALKMVLMGISQQRCDERWLYRALMGHGFLLLFCLAMVGNFLNVIICHSEQIRFYVAIRMLRIKLYMNTGMMIAMLPQALQIVELWESGGEWDVLYWRTWPYQAFLIHVFGFCANWLTVLMTTECFLHVFLPTKSRAICTKRTLWKCFAIVVGIAVLLSSTYPLNRVVTFPVYCKKFTMLIHASKTGAMGIVEQVHIIANFLLSILSPLILLVFMSVMISWRLVIFPRYYRYQNNQNLLTTSTRARNGGGGVPLNRFRIRPSLEKHFSSEKIGVTRITLITTLIQLITETPSMPVLIWAAIYGPLIVNESVTMCTWQTFAHFLGLTNASLSFFIYIVLSSRFRNTLKSRFRKLFHGLLSTPVSGADGCVNGSTQPATPLSALAYRANSLVAITARRLGGGKHAGAHRARVMTIAVPQRELSTIGNCSGGTPSSPTASTRPLLQLVAREPTSTSCGF